MFPAWDIHGKSVSHYMARERECGMADMVFTAAGDPARLGQRDFLLDFEGRRSHMNPSHRTPRNSKMTQILQYVTGKRAGFISAVYIFFNTDLFT